MCLELKSNKTRKQTAKKDIVCYKVVKCYSRYNKEDTLETYYRDRIVEIGQTYTSELQRVVDSCDDARIEIGLHTFVTLKRAKQFIDWRWSTNLKIVKCIIPADSNYYVGKFDLYNNYRESYASDTLKYVELVN